MTDLTAARAARTEAALDKRVHLNGEVHSFRERLERGDYAYRTVRAYRDGKRRYGLIEHADATETLAGAPEGGREFYPGHGDPLQELTFAAYLECPKLVYDAADGLPEVLVSPDSFEVVRVITDDEWAHLTERAS